MPGPAGAQGPQGEPGKDAEVVSTGVIVVQASQWITADSLEWHAVITTTMITQEIVERSAVQVFVKKNDVWHVLPYINHTTFITFAYEVGKVHLFTEDSHGSRPQPPVTENYKITVVSDAERPVPQGHTPNHSTPVGQF